MSEIQHPQVIEESVSPETGIAPKAQPPAAGVAQPDKAAVAEVKDAEGDADFSRKFAALTKRQKEIYLKEKELKEKWSLVEKYQKSDELKKTNPWGWAKEHGLDFDMLAQSALKDGEPPSVEDELKAIKERLAKEDQDREDAKKKSDEEAKQAEVQRQVKAYSDSLNSEIESNPDEYEQILIENAQDEVLNYVIGYYNKTLAETGEGVVLPVKAAANKVEEYLVEQNKAKAAKYLSSKKLGLKQEPSQPTEAPTRTMGATLNQQLTPASSAPTPRNESPEEKRRRIAAEFNARLKK